MKHNIDQHDINVNGDNFKELKTAKIREIWNLLKKEPAYFWLLCAYIFFEYVRPQTVYPVIDILPWAFLLLLLTLVTWLTHPKREIPKTKLTAPVLFLFLVIIISSIFSHYPDWSFRFIDIPINWLILYFLFIGIVTTKSRLFIVVLLLLLVSFKMSYHASFAWAMRGFTFERWGISGGAGWFGNAADLGVQLCIFTPMAVGFYFSFKDSWGRLKKAFFFSFAVTGVMGIIATGQRGTMLGLICMGLYAILLSKHKIKSLFIVAFVATVVYSLMPQAYMERFNNMGEDTTSQSRLHYWGRGVDIFKSNPIIGVGYVNWVPYYKAHFPGESLRADKQEVAHSTPVTVLAELGTIGFFAYYLIAVKILLINRRIRKESRPDTDVFFSNMAVALNIGLIGFLVTSTFLSIAYYPFLWMQASLTAALEAVRNKETTLIKESKKCP